MPKVTVRKCPRTGKVFFGDDEYAKHIVALRNHLNGRRRAKHERKIIRERMWYALSNITSPRVLAEYVTNHMHDIMIVHCGINEAAIAKIREMELIHFEFTSLHFNEHCSNYHKAPRDGVTNSGRKEGVPTGYPGFYGRISLAYKNAPKFGMECFKLDNGNIVDTDVVRALNRIGIKTGSGGGNPEVNIGYDVTLFLSDFRAMKKAYFHAKLEDRDFVES